MNRDDRAFNREIETMLERGRAIRPLPDVVRARALARARATIATSADAASAPAAPVPARTHRWRIALAAAFTLLIGGAGAVAAVRGGVLDRFRPAPAAVPATPAPVAPPRADIPAAVAQEPESIPKPIEKRRAARPPTPQESYAAELGLLHRAHVTYASRDFSSALILIAEHTRRFPNGRLAEEREALRVRSLAGSGRTADARRAVATFSTRFPRSVLLPRLQEIAGTPRGDPDACEGGSCDFAR